MKEHPILFSAPMVRAILEGRKTVTRRVMKPQPPKCQHQPWPGSYEPRWVADSDGWHCATCGNGVRHDRHSKTRVAGIRCPYGQPGDRLWVRESHLLDPPIDGTWPSNGDSFASINDIPERYRNPEHVIYRADDKLSDIWRWRPSIHMPRWASRITLEVTGVRVERLQNITHEQAIAEGVHVVSIGSGYRDRYSAATVAWSDVVEGTADAYEDARLAFRDLWDGINAARGFGWAANPWVWAVEFKRVQP